jgi:hypothetical protein
LFIPTADLPPDDRVTSIDGSKSFIKIS